MADHETENLATKYDTFYQADQNSPEAKPITLKGWPRNRNEAMVYLARPGGRLLEIGSGTGPVVATLAPQFDFALGTELSAVRTENARTRWQHIPNLEFRHTTLETLVEQEAEPFDCIIWADVIEHVVDIIGTMKLLAQLSRPGTQLVTVTPNIAYLPRRWRALQGYAPATSSLFDTNEGFFVDRPEETILRDGGHLHYITFSQLDILYHTSGFQVEQRLGVGNRFSQLRNWWPTLLSGAVCVSGTYRG